MREPIRVVDKPPICAVTSGAEVWWWSQRREAWFIGDPIMMDWTDPATWEEWTHWLPKYELPEPTDVPDPEVCEECAYLFAQSKESHES